MMRPRPPSFGALADTLGFQLRRAAAIFQSALEAQLEPLGLRASEATLLIYVGENPGRTQSEIGRELRIKLANMIPTVGRLASAGLLQRMPGEGRAIALHLTEAGDERVAQVQQAMQRLEERLARRMSPRDKQRVTEALRTVIPLDCEEPS
jgi:DNA-binding MarR family transcriptional regulator